MKPASWTYWNLKNGIVGCFISTLSIKSQLLHWQDNCPIIQLPEGIKTATNSIKFQFQLIMPQTRTPNTPWKDWQGLGGGGSAGKGPKEIPTVPFSSSSGPKPRRNLIFAAITTWAHFYSWKTPSSTWILPSPLSFLLLSAQLCQFTLSSTN